MNFKYVRKTRTDTQNEGYGTGARQPERGIQQTQRGQGRGEMYTEACLIIRDIEDLNVGVNAMSVRINVWATSR
jgi:hypothetical protein